MFLNFRLFLVIVLFKVVPKCSIEVLSSIAKCEKAEFALWGKYVSDKLCLDLSHNVAGCELNVNELTIFIK
jgi:hypothetical protein